MKQALLQPIEPGPYFIDPDGDPSTSLRVVYDVAADGWSQWIGAAKFSGVGHVGLSVTTVSNLVTDGCTNHHWADPAVGPSVDDLALALTKLHPFEVTVTPEEVSIDGYSGKHLSWIVPEEQEVTTVGGESRFAGCIGGKLMSWVAFIDTTDTDAFYGYTGPRYAEEFLILNVDGTRLMIATEQSAGSSAQDLAELDDILESIRIEP